MQLHEAMMNRKSIGKVKPDPLDRALIEQLLEAAVRAPNHYRTEPWRFFVMSGDGRKRLGQAYAAIAAEDLAKNGEAITKEERSKQEAKAFRAPVVIAVAASPAIDQPKVHLVEELAAVHAAVQNMLLTAHALGLGAIWRSGDPAYHPLMKAAFGLAEHESLVGLIYVGYPDFIPGTSPRTHYSQKTVWMTDN